MKRDLGNGIELDDDKARIDRAEVHLFLSQVSYWAEGRPRETQDGLIDSAARVVGLYDYRGRGLGEALVREMVEESSFADLRWLLHTSDMHPLYRKLGFEEPDYKLMERRSTRKASESG